MSGVSRVVPVDGDQRNPSKAETSNAERYEAGQQNSHLPNDSKDERTIANKLANEERKLNKPDEPPSREAALSQEDPTLPARVHGHEPSKGAKIDAELQAEEEEMLKKKK